MLGDLLEWTAPCISKLGGLNDVVLKMTHLSNCRGYVNHLIKVNSTLPLVTRGCHTPVGLENLFAKLWLFCLKCFVTFRVGLEATCFWSCSHIQKRHNLISRNRLSQRTPEKNNPDQAYCELASEQRHETTWYAKLWSFSTSQTYLEYNLITQGYQSITPAKLCPPPWYHYEAFGCASNCWQGQL